MSIACAFSLKLRKKKRVFSSFPNRSQIFKRTIHQMEKICSRDCYRLLSLKKYLPKLFFKKTVMGQATL